MMPQIFAVPILIAVALVSCTLVRSHQPDYYTAAVYEHRRIGLEIDESSPATVRANLEWYERAASVARQQGADMILFPEYGLFPPAITRNDIRPFLEVVPNPKKIKVNPCAEADIFSDRPILYALSCMAKSNDIVVVANMGSLEPCQNENYCPEDGNLQFNANVAFDKNGSLIARYYKERLYTEDDLDLPREEQDPIFETQFGKFAMFICFDMIYEKMAVTSHLQDVDAILFSTMWFGSLPLYSSTQWFQSWAIGNNATLIAANIQIPGYSLVGSGIFRGRKGSVVHTFNPDGVPKLMVATLPRRNQDISSRTQLTAILKNGTGPVKGDGINVPTVCSFKVLGRTQNVYNDYRCINADVSNYTLVKLKENEGFVRACSNKMCCELEYARNNANESFYLGVHNGTNNPFQTKSRYKWEEEDCFLARCDDVNGTNCSNFLTMSETFFYKITLKANFTTTYIYPSIVSNGLKLVPVNDWIFSSKFDTSTIEVSNSSGIHLVAVSLTGRVYERDPPFIK